MKIPVVSDFIGNPEVVGSVLRYDVYIAAVVKEKDNCFGVEHR